MPIENKKQLKILKQFCQQYNITIEDLLQRLLLYPDSTKRLLQFPLKPTEWTKININTVQKKLPLWMDNLRDNLEAIKTGSDIKTLPKVKNRPTLIIGAGPSLKRKKHLELLAEKGFDGIIFATDRILKDCLDNGIIPDYVLFIDADKTILKFIDYDIVDEYATKLAAIMNIFTHPAVVKRWHGEIFWYANYIDDLFLPNISHVLQLLTKTTTIASSGHVSSIGWTIATRMNCNPQVCIGIDLSFPADMPVEELEFYKRYMREFKGNKKFVRELFNNHYHHKFFNTDCYFEPVFKSYINSTMLQLKKLAAKGIKFVNCTEGGALEGDNLECMFFEDYLNSQASK